MWCFSEVPDEKTMSALATGKITGSWILNHSWIKMQSCGPWWHSNSTKKGRWVANFPCNMTKSNVGSIFKINDQLCFVQIQHFPKCINLKMNPTLYFLSFLTQPFLDTILNISSKRGFNLCFFLFLQIRTFFTDSGRVFPNWVRGKDLLALADFQD